MLEQLKEIHSQLVEEGKTEAADHVAYAIARLIWEDAQQVVASKGGGGGAEV